MGMSEVKVALRDGHLLARIEHIIFGPILRERSWIAYVD